MNINYENPGHLKMCLLLEGINFTKDALKDVGSKCLERRLPYNCGDDIINEILIPPEIILPNETIVTVRYRKKSPWRVDIRNGEMVLKYSNKIICPISFPTRPLYYGKLLSNGISCENVVTKYSIYNLGFFTPRYCHFFYVGLQCKFCSLEPTKKRDPLMISIISPYLALEAAKTAFENDNSIKNIVWSGGTHKNFDYGVTYLAKLISEVNKVKPQNVCHHVFVMPPYNFEILKSLKDLGVNEITFSLDIFDNNLFRSICPGKFKFYGHKKFFKVMEYAVEIFGYGNVSCNFIAGLEPLDSLLKGFESVVKIGVKPSVPIFHPDIGTEFENKSPPSFSYIFKMAKKLYEIYKEYGFRPILYKARGASLDCEIYDGWFK